MAKLPELNQIKVAIEDKEYPQSQRVYLGMSGIGEECLRKQWFGWRWVKEVTINARKQRIFNRGDLEEPRIIKDLESIGVTVTDDQLEVKHFTGHSLGHIDGIATNVLGAEKTAHLAEFKTMKASSFNKFSKNIILLGFAEALKEYSKSYWYQIQLYMGYLGLKRTLYVVTNKDTEERIYERTNFIPEDFEQGKEIILTVLTAENPNELPRISEREDYFKCKWCEFSSVCFGHLRAETNCRTCAHADLQDNGVWECDLNNSLLSKEAQKKGCNQHRYLIGL